MRKLSTKQGFTLAELMVTVAVMAIMLMGLFAALTTSLFTSENSKWQVRQQKLAQLIMEELLSKSYSELSTLAGLQTGNRLGSGTEETIDGVKYRTLIGWEYDASSSGLKAKVTVHQPMVDIMQITVVVEVPGRDNRPPFVLSTLRGKSSL